MFLYIIRSERSSKSIRYLAESSLAEGVAVVVMVVPNSSSEM